MSDLRQTMRRGYLRSSMTVAVLLAVLLLATWSVVSTVIG